MALERVIKISGAYDGTSHPRNYGIGSMQIWMYVKGPKGGVSCNFATSWYLPQNQQRCYEMVSKGYPFDVLEEVMQPKGTDISYHSKERVYDWATPIQNCEITDGECHCDGSSLQAQEHWQPIFLHEGSEGVFKRLEQYYCNHFEDGSEVNLVPTPRTFPE